MTFSIVLDQPVADTGKSFFLSKVGEYYTESSCTYVHKHHGLVPNSLFDSPSFLRNLPVATENLSTEERRQIALFEVLYQRSTRPETKDQIVAIDLGVLLSSSQTILEEYYSPRLQEISRHHHVLLAVPKDGNRDSYWDALQSQADNAISVPSTKDIKQVQINDRTNIPLKDAILALSCGDGYLYQCGDSDEYQFLLNTTPSLLSNRDWTGLTALMILSISLFWLSIGGGTLPSDSGMKQVLESGRPGAVVLAGSSLVTAVWNLVEVTDSGKKNSKATPKSVDTPASPQPQPGILSDLVMDNDPRIAA